MNVKIRRAELDDLKEIQQFGYQLLKYEHDNWDNTLELDWPFSEQGEAAYIKAIKEKYAAIAEVAGEPVGFLIGSVKHPDPKSARQITTAQLENIFVDKKVQGQGIGKQLAQEFKKYCLAEGVNTINVTVNSRNNQAIQFYEKIGFLPSRVFMSLNIISN